MHWVGPLLGAACAALSCHVLLYPVDEEDGVGEEKGRNGGAAGKEGRGQRNAVYRGVGGDSEEANPLCVSLSTSQLLQKSAGSTRPLNRSMSGGPEWKRGEGEGSRERREGEGREERELRREVVGGRGEKEEREEGVDKHSGSSSGYMSGPPGRSR